MAVKTINILMACNDKFFNGACSTILSILDHTDAEIKLYFGGDICIKNKTRLQKYVKNIVFIDELIRDKIEDVKDIYCPSHISIESMYRVIAPFFVECEKLIWLDSDMIVLTDLIDLYDVNLCNNAIGVAIHEDGNGTVVKNYFNAGMVVFDVKTIKNRYTIEQMLTFIRDNQNKFQWYDESIMNIFYRKDSLYLDHKFNYVLYNRLLDRKYPFDSKEVIIHYIGVIKPWNKRYFSFKNKKYFWRYGRKTFGFFYYLRINFFNYIVYPYYLLRRLIFKVGAE